MSLRKTVILDNEYYHIYNRGIEKREIFLDEEDYFRFIKLLYLCNSKKRINFRIDIIEKNIDAWDFDREDQIVSIGAWVLMPNHFHLYITGSRSLASGKNNDINIITFLQKLSTAYAKYFNAKYNRTGSLFEGKFKSVHIENDNQAKYLFSYIHLNPIKLIQKNWKEEGIKDKNKALEFLDNYRWSSYCEYLEFNRKEKAILNRENFLDYFISKEVFKKEIFEWISIAT